MLHNLIKIDANHVIFFYNSSIFHLIYQFTKFNFFRKYVPAVKTMNEWMKKMAVTWVDKNESFFKRTHNLSRPSYRFHSNIVRSLAPPRHLSFWVLGCLRVSTGLWLTNLLRFSNYCICTNDIIPYEWFRALEYYRMYVWCSLSIFCVRKDRGLELHSL